MKELELQAYMDEALAEEVGFKVQTNDTVRLRNRFYNIQLRERKQGNTIYDALAFRFPPERDQLWLIKKEALNGN